MLQVDEPNVDFCLEFWVHILYVLADTPIQILAHRGKPGSFAQAAVRATMASARYWEASRVSWRPRQM